MSFGQAAHRRAAVRRSNGHAAQFMPAKSERGLNGVPSSPHSIRTMVPMAAMRDETVFRRAVSDGCFRETDVILSPVAARQNPESRRPNPRE